MWKFPVGKLSDILMSQKIYCGNSLWEKFEFAPSTSLIHKDDTFIDTTEERSRALSYTWEVNDPNTFTFHI